MEQLIQAFGIDIKLIIVQIINFGILLALLSYFLYKPVLKLLAEREQKITQGIKDAEAAAAAKADADTEKQSIVSAAQNEATQITEKATEHARVSADEIVADARDKADAVARKASKDAEELKKQTIKDSEADVAKTAVLAAEKILRNQSNA